MKCKVAAVAGAIIGWGGAGALIFVGHDMQAILLQAFLLTVGLTGVAWLMLSCRNRPLAHAFELGRDAGWGEGYREGRADAACDGDGGKVVRLRRVSM